MQDFAAIDFETANNERSSVCSVGIVIVRGGKQWILSTRSLSRTRCYNYWCSQVHGLCNDDTCNAPVFPKVWKQMKQPIEGLPLVAHNKPFDEELSKAVFRVYQMDYPDYEFYDTLCVSRRVFPSWRTTSFTPLLPAVIGWRTITMHFRMLRHVHGQQEKYYKLFITNERQDHFMIKYESDTQQIHSVPWLLGYKSLWRCIRSQGIYA